MSPYRARVSQRVLHVETSLGPARVSLGPHSVSISLGDTSWTVANHLLVIVSKGKRRSKKRSFRLGPAHLFVAKGWPTGEVSLWIEGKPGVVRRVLALPPTMGISEEAMTSLRTLDRLAASLQEALAEYGAGSSAIDYGSGANRVLLLRYPSALILHARRVFRPQPQQIVTLRSDGSLVFPKRRSGARIIRIKPGGNVIASGDYVRFCQRDGENVDSVFLPWLDSADRAEIGRQFQSLLAEATAL